MRLGPTSIDFLIRAMEASHLFLNIIMFYSTHSQQGHFLMLLMPDLARTLLIAGDGDARAVDSFAQVSVGVPVDTADGGPFLRAEALVVYRKTRRELYNNVTLTFKIMFASL